MPKPQRLARKNGKRSLNALAVAENEVQEDARIPKNRINTLRKEEAERELSEIEQGPARKRSKVGRGSPTEFESEGDSDGDSSQVRIGGVHSNDDSSLDSDEAFGESDDEKFGDFTFRGSSGVGSRTLFSTDGFKGLRAIPRPNGKATQTTSSLGKDRNHIRDHSTTPFENDALDYSRRDDDDYSQRPALDTANHSSLRADELSSDEEKASELSLSDNDDGTGDMEMLSKLQELAAAFGQDTNFTNASRPRFDSTQEAATPSEYGIRSRQKLSVQDLLATVADPQGRKALRMMADDGKRSKSAGEVVPGKLEVPLAKRTQDALDRSAAYKKSKETLSRWIDTVKHNRRAEHLVFPLPDGDAAAAKNTSRLPTTSAAKPMTDLEATIQNILLESGLAQSSNKSQDAQLRRSEEFASNQMPIEDVQARRAELRRNRDLLFREEIRAKRIKKIKSKSYRRVHRKERQRNLLREKEILGETAVDLEPEQERLEKARAEERMNGRHKESRWAKSMKEIGRTVWDSEARDELTDMARRNEELRQRIQGKVARDSDLSGSESGNSSLDSDSDPKHARQTLQKHLGRLGSGANAEDTSRLGSLKFMQRANANQQLENDEAIKNMMVELADENDSGGASKEQRIIGRRRYGPEPDAGLEVESRATNEFEEYQGSSDREAREDAQSDHEVEIITKQPDKPREYLSAGQRSAFDHEKTAPRNPKHSEDNPWLVTAKGSHDGKLLAAENAVLVSKESNTSQDRMAPAAGYHHSHDQPPLRDESTSKSRLETVPRLVENQDVRSELPDQEANESSFEGFSPSGSDSEEAGGSHKTNAELIRRAFASDDVLAASSFAAERAALEAEEGEGDELEGASSNHLPGWGSWTGEGLPKRDRRQAAASAANARKRSESDAAKQVQQPRADGALHNAMISQKRVPKTARYLATALPRPFESRAQYERSLRLPVGREWVAGETFREMVRPRVEVRAGEVVAAMSRPI